MGLHPIVGRLLDMRDDGPSAPVPLCSRTASEDRLSIAIRLVIGKTVTLGERSATIVGVLEPSVPYPAETEIIANVVTSPHHFPQPWFRDACIA